MNWWPNHMMIIPTTNRIHMSRIGNTPKSTINRGWRTCIWPKTQHQTTTNHMKWWQTRTPTSKYSPWVTIRWRVSSSSKTMRDTTHLLTSQRPTNCIRRISTTSSIRSQPRRWGVTRIIICHRLKMLYSSQVWAEAIWPRMSNKSCTERVRRDSRVISTISQVRSKAVMSVPCPALTWMVFREVTVIKKTMESSLTFRAKSSLLTSMWSIGRSQWAMLSKLQLD